MNDMLGQVVRKLVQLPEETLGTLFDLGEKLAGSNGQMWFCALKKMLRQENSWAAKIFEVKTDGRTGAQFITDLERQGNAVGSYAKQLLLSKEFVATEGVTYKFAVIAGDEFNDDKRTNENIRAEARRRGYLKPPVELAPLVREKFSDEEIEWMGFWALIIMHQPIAVSGGDPDLLGAARGGAGRSLDAFRGRPGYRWVRERGFLFLVPQVAS